MKLHLVLGDQLHRGLLRLDSPETAPVLLFVESSEFVTRLPYHRHKIALVFSAMRHFAAELVADGFRVTYIRFGERDGSLGEILTSEMPRIGANTLVCATPRERTTRDSLRALAARAGWTLTLLPDTLWMTWPEDYAAWRAKRAGELKMEDFYRDARRRTGVLMDGKNPVGGAWNFDKENRKPFPKTHQPVPRFVVEPDEITREVLETVAKIDGLTGSTDGFSLPVSRADSLAALADFIRNRLPNFGPYEDAMRADDPFGYHSILSPALNLSLISPRECVDAAISAYESGDAPLQSVEGFVRQILGWREFLYHRFEERQESVGDYHETNFLGHVRPLPEFYWTGETKMRCLSTVVKRVLANGYSHHIERLMVLGNFALLAGVDPHALNRWFWACYVDAFEWVVTPNVVGMSQFADGGFIATKPYISSGAYIDRMSDFCGGCEFDPKDAVGDSACPFTTLYWAFLIERAADAPLSARMAQNYFGLKNKDDVFREAVLTKKRIALPMWTGPGSD